MPRRTSRNGPRRTTRNKELQKLMKAARQQGWLVEGTKGGHFRFVPPDASKPAVVSSGTPSDHRSMLNLRAQLRRSGLKANRRSRGRLAAGTTIVARPTGRVLLLRRSPLVNHPGLWGVPAGGVEAGEDVLAAAMRELWEETRFRGPVQLLGHDRYGPFHNFTVVCSDEFEPRLNWENDMAGWFAPGYQPQPLHPGMHRIFARL